MKPKIIVFYESDEFLDSILDEAPFKYKDEVIVLKKSLTNAFVEIEYINYHLLAYKLTVPKYEFVRGYRPSKIIMEKSLHDRTDQETIERLESKLVINGILGSFKVEVMECRNFESLL